MSTSKLVVNLFDRNFPGHACSVPGKTPRRMAYVREQEHWDGITLFTDGSMFDPFVDIVRSRWKVGWLQESYSLHPENYERIHGMKHKFDVIMTTRQDLIASDPQKFRYTIRGGIWTPREQWAIYPKTKNVSMILSDKRSTEGHKLRHQIAETIPGIDLYGPSYTPIGHDKAQALRDYRYTIVVENERSEGCFSEQPLDAIAYGCIPLYWGDPLIGEHLELQGIFRWKELDELRAWFDAMSFIDGCVDQYVSSVPVSYFQLQNLPDLEITEDWFSQHILEPLTRGELV